jgi:hypothetical protein
MGTGCLVFAHEELIIRNEPSLSLGNDAAVSHLDYETSFRTSQRPLQKSQRDVGLFTLRSRERLRLKYNYR